MLSFGRGTTHHLSTSPEIEQRICGNKSVSYPTLIPPQATPANPAAASPSRAPHPCPAATPPAAYPNTAPRHSHPGPAGTEPHSPHGPPRHPAARPRRPAAAAHPPAPPASGTPPPGDTAPSSPPPEPPLPGSPTYSARCGGDTRPPTETPRSAPSAASPQTPAHRDKTAAPAPVPPPSNAHAQSASQNEFSSYLLDIPHPAADSRHCPAERYPYLNSGLLRPTSIM